MYKTIKIEKGPGGWGGPLIIKATEKRNKVVCITGGDIHPIAQHIADISNMELVNGFKTGVPDDEIAVAIVDCGGTARCGVYPKKGVFTVNILPVGKAGPLAQFITEDIYVSDVKISSISVLEGEYEVPKATNTSKSVAEKMDKSTRQSSFDVVGGSKENFLSRFGKTVGGVVGIFYQSGRDTIETVMKNIIPFMGFVSMLIGIILVSGIGDFIAKTISPYAGSLPGLLVISVVCAIPILSPLLGPGAVIAQVVGVLIGVEIGKGTIPPQYALPALFAINPQVGCDFIPVGLSLGDAEHATIEVGVPTILLTRLVTGPLSVVIAYFIGIGLYS